MKLYTMNLAGYLSENDLDQDLLEDDLNDWSNYDPINDLKSRLIEPLNKENYIPICCNIMFEVEKDMGKRDIEICVAVLNTIDELKELQHYHDHIVKKLYQLADNGKLEKYFKKKNGCCIIL